MNYISHRFISISKWNESLEGGTHEKKSYPGMESCLVLFRQASSTSTCQFVIPFYVSLKARCRFFLSAQISPEGVTDKKVLRISDTCKYSKIIISTEWRLLFVLFCVEWKMKKKTSLLSSTTKVANVVESIHSLFRDLHAKGRKIKLAGELRVQVITTTSEVINSVINTFRQPSRSNKLVINSSNDDCSRNTSSEPSTKP